jgi:hypothetical protein
MWKIANRKRLISVVLYRYAHGAAQDGLHARLACASTRSRQHPFTMPPPGNVNAWQYQ